MDKKVDQLGELKIAANKTVVAGLEPDKKKVLTYWFDHPKGFAIRVNPGGSKTFFYQGRLSNGREKKVTIGTLGRITPQAAQKRALVIAGEIAKGIDPSIPKNAQSSSVSLGDLLEAYVTQLEAQGKPSAKAVRNSISRHVKLKFPRLWKKAAAEIALDDCIKVVGAIVDEGKVRQADLLRSYLKSAYTSAINSRGDVNVPRAMRDLKLTSNPASELKKVKGSSQARERVLSNAELQSYWRRVQELPTPTRQILALHVILGGQRQQQLVRVTTDDIDRDNGCIELLDPKGRRSAPRKHVIPLLPQAVECIEQLTRISGRAWVFSCNGGISPIHPTYMHKYAKRICEDMADAGELEKGEFTAGSIRSTVETRLAAKPYRVSSDVLAQLLSHGLGGVQNRHYQRHDFFDEKLEALQKLMHLLEGESGNVRALRLAR